MYLRTASAFVASGIGASAPAAAARTPPAWDETTLYQRGDRVTHAGYVWLATLASRTAEPTDSSVYWTQTAPVDRSGSSTPTDDNSDTAPTTGPGEQNGNEPSTSGLPKPVFAPYDHVSTRSKTTPIDHAQQAETRYFHLAFVLAGPSGTPAWDGNGALTVGDSYVDDYIQQLSDAGGDVIVSFGGAAGPYLAKGTDNPTVLADRFETVIDTYDATQLDIDEEQFDMQLVARRNEALAIVQERRPEVTIEFTLPATTQGLNPQGKQVVQDAIDKGVEIDTINIMTMNYGWVEPSAHTVTQSATHLHDQLGSLFPSVSSADRWRMVGITPMIGVNNAGGTFYQDDARQVLEFAQSKGVGLLSFWSIDRDNGTGSGQVSPVHSGIEQVDYEFSSIFAPFTSG